LSERSSGDAELLRRCAAGDGAAWDLLIERYRRLIYSIPAAFRMSVADCDDVFQRVALKLVQRMSEIRDPAALAGWLATVTRHECHALHREGSRRVDTSVEDWEPAVEPPDLEERLNTIAREHQVALALDALEEPCRSLLRMLYVEEPTPPYDQIAQRLGRPIGSLGPTRSRCLEKLRARLVPEPEPATAGRSSGQRRPKRGGRV
jgi:RNA polymerase sigma factor (sigma-70 family)